jgi:serine/threonine protein phosphatase 1
MDFLRDLTLTHREGGYLFVHGGVRRACRWSSRREDLLRMRQPFLYSRCRSARWWAWP